MVQFFILDSYCRIWVSKLPRINLPHSCNSFEVFSSYFENKHKSSVSFGSKDFFDMLTRVLNFSSKNVVKIALKVMQRNSYLAHLDNIISEMLASQNFQIRKKIYKTCTIVLGLRNYQKSTITIRKFIVPQINSIANFFHILPICMIKA